MGKVDFMAYQILGHNNQGIVGLITQSNFVFRSQNSPWMSWRKPTHNTMKLRTLNFVQKLPISIESFTDFRLMLAYQILGHNNQVIVGLITQSYFVFRSRNSSWMSWREPTHNTMNYELWILFKNFPYL